jgi:hypothetical protein
VQVSCRIHSSLFSRFAYIQALSSRSSVSLAAKPAHQAKMRSPLRRCQATDLEQETEFRERCRKHERQRASSVISRMSLSPTMTGTGLGLSGALLSPRASSRSAS